MCMKFLYRLLNALIVIALLQPLSGSAETGFEDAVLVENAALDYPDAEYESGREGWTLLSYVVNREGVAVDALVEDSSGSPAFDRAALAAVSQLRYSPARLSGAPVERCFSQQKITFQKPPHRYDVARRFENDLGDVNKSTRAGRHDEAAAMLAALDESYPRNLFEDARFWLTSANLAQARGDLSGEISHLRRAIAYEGVYLPDALYAAALKRLYNAEMQSGLVADSLATSERLGAIRMQDRDVAALVAHSVEQRRKLDELDFFSTPVTLVEGKVASHSLLRDRFSFLVESGSLDDFELRCRAHRARLTVKVDAEWAVPGGWQDCSLYFDGAPGTVFYVNELR